MGILWMINIMNENKKFCLLINQNIMTLIENVTKEGYIIPELDNNTVRKMIECLARFTLLSYNLNINSINTIGPNDDGMFYTNWRVTTPDGVDLSPSDYI